MAKRARYHVVPSQGKGWQVKQEGAARPSSAARTQDRAVSNARSLARRHQLGQVIIHRPDGTIREEHTYHKDPYPPKG